VTCRSGLPRNAHQNDLISSIFDYDDRPEIAAPLCGSTIATLDPAWRYAFRALVLLPAPKFRFLTTKPKKIAVSHCALVPETEKTQPTDVAK